MEFEYEEAAKELYDEYARRVGFVVCIDLRRRSEVDKRVLSRRFCCNKQQGFCAKTRDELGKVRRQRGNRREGCKAMMLVKANKLGKWAVTRFVKENYHSLVVSDRPSGNSMDTKHRRIEELTMELVHHDPLCELYRKLLLTLLKNGADQAEHLSTKIGVVVNIREFESLLQQLTKRGSSLALSVEAMCHGLPHLLRINSLFWDPRTCLGSGGDLSRIMGEVKKTFVNIYFLIFNFGDKSSLNI
ncbi:hypothetical protein UlMin_031974 [Ulmus minor]